MGRLLSLLTIGMVLSILSVSPSISQEATPLRPPNRFDHAFRGKLVEHPGDNPRSPDVVRHHVWCAIPVFGGGMCFTDGKALRNRLYAKGRTSP